MDKNFSDIPSFFTTRLEGQTFYRPLSREVFNLIMYKSFGLNALAFHLVNLGLIILNTFVVFLITKKLANKDLSVIAAILYGLNAVHSIELYYLASVQTLLATALMLTSTYFYSKFLENKQILTYFSSLSLFLLAVLCHESAIVLPGILLMVEIFKVKTRFKDLFKRLFLFGVLSLIYIISILSLLSLPKQEVYQPVFHLKNIINTLTWYSLWSLNFPEALVDFVVDFNINPNFIKWYENYFKIAAVLSISLFSALILIVSFSAKRVFSKLFLLFIFSFLISLSPFLFFPQHKFVYYLSFPLVWMTAILALILSVAWQKNLTFKILCVVTIFIFGLFAFQTVQFNKITHWAAKRAVAAKFLLESIQKEHPKTNKNTSFYILDDPDYPNIAKEWGTSSKQAFYILSGSDALKLLYKDSSIKVFYEANGPPDVDALNYVARFPY